MKDESRQSIEPRGLFPSFILHSSALFLCFYFCLTSAFAGQVNINTAKEEELTSLPYIGTARAQAIISHRKQHGTFQHIDDLLLVDSIGPKSVEAIRPYLSGVNTLAETAVSSSTFPGNDRIMLLADADYFPVLINFIKNAQKRIDIAVFLFKTTESKNNKPTQLVDELIKAHKRGVFVQLVLEHSGYNESINKENQRVATTLTTNGITVRFDSPKKTTHTKMVIIDNRFCFVGSHNLSHSALAFNHEMSLLLDSRRMAGELTDYIATIK